MIADGTWRSIISNYKIEESLLREFIEYLSLRQWHQLRDININFERELKANFDIDLGAEWNLFQIKFTKEYLSDFYL